MGIKLTPQQAAEEAMGHFKEGCNCAEAVLLAFLGPESGLPREAVCLATGFGGGMGRTKSVCGAVTGALMALGTALGRREPLDPERRQENARQLGQDIYPPFARLLAQVEGHYGTVVCRELTDPYVDFAGKARRKNCQEIVGFCAAAAARLAEG